MTYIFSAKANCSTESITGLVRQLIQELKTQSLLPFDQLMDLRLILSELMINAGEHGNKNCPDKSIDVRVIVDDEQVKITVRDEGPGFRPETVLRASPNKCSGRGLLIVDALCDSFQVQESTIFCTMKREKGLA